MTRDTETRGATLLELCERAEVGAEQLLSELETLRLGLEGYTATEARHLATALHEVRSMADAVRYAAARDRGQL